MLNVLEFTRRRMASIVLGAAVMMSVPAVAAAQELPTVGQPVLITSLGQSLDAFQLQLAVKRARIDLNFDQLAKPDMVAGAEGLFLAVGASLKGFGEAGISIADERNRARAFIDAAKAKNIPIVVFHLGGKERRDDLSNQLIEVTAPYANALVIMEGGDDDRFFTKIAEENKIPLIVVKSMPELLPVLGQLVRPPA